MQAARLRFAGVPQPCANCTVTAVPGMINSPMRIVHVVESKSPSAGSVWVCLRGLARQLGALQIAATAVDSGSELAAEVSKTDLVHIFGWNYPNAIKAAQLAKISGKPMVLSPMGGLTFKSPGLFDRIRRRFNERPLIRSARSLTAVHECESQSLRADHAQADIRLLPLGFDFDEYKDLQSNDSSRSNLRNLLVLAPIDPANGCVILLKAFAEIGQSADGWTVTLAGPDPLNMRAKLEAAVRRKGGESRVTFSEAGSVEKQKDLLAKADLLVDASLRVSAGVSIMQALAASVAALATDLAAPTQTTGLVRMCGPRREELREALRECLPLSTATLREKARSAREKARGSLDWSVLAPRYAEMYERCLRA